MITQFRQTIQKFVGQFLGMKLTDNSVIIIVLKKDYFVLIFQIFVEYIILIFMTPNSRVLDRIHIISKNAQTILRLVHLCRVRIKPPEKSSFSLVGKAAQNL